MSNFKNITKNIRINMDKVISVEKFITKSGSGMSPYDFKLEVTLIPEGTLTIPKTVTYTIASCSHDEYQKGKKIENNNSVMFTNSKEYDEFHSSEYCKCVEKLNSAYSKF